MTITDVRVRKIAKEGKMKALVSVTLDDEFVVHDIKVIEGEKRRIKQGGKPILSPPIGAVITHFDVFKSMYEAQRQYQARTTSALADINALRPAVEDIILRVWNMVEKHYENEPPETRFNLCRRFGVVYYYRRHEEREC